MSTESNLCCNCCDELLTGVEQLNIDKRRALIALQNASMAMASLDHDAAKKYIRAARAVLTSRNEQA